MTGRFVLDCSVTMAWCFEDEAGADADAALTALMGGAALAPSIWPLEVVSVLLVAERRGRLAHADAVRFLDLLRGLPVAVVETTFDVASRSVHALARRYGLSAYDAAYLDLAMREDARLATRDRALRRAATAAGVGLLAA